MKKSKESLYKHCLGRCESPRLRLPPPLPRLLYFFCKCQLWPLKIKDQSILCAFMILQWHFQVHQGRSSRFCWSATRLIRPSSKKTPQKQRRHGDDTPQTRSVSVIR